MTDDRSAGEVVRQHVVRGRRCRCPKHHADCFPEVCTPEYEAMSPREQLALCELRCGVVRDIEALGGVVAWTSSPRPYVDGDPIKSPLDADEW